MRYLSDILSWPQESCLTASATFYLAANLHVSLNNRKAAIYYAVQALKAVERHLRGEDGLIDVVESLELRMFAPSLGQAFAKTPKPEEFRLHILYLAATMMMAESFYDEAMQLTADGMQDCNDLDVVRMFDALSKICISKITDQNKRLAKARLQAFKQQVDERSLKDGVKYFDLAFYQNRDKSCPQRIAVGAKNAKYIDLDPMRYEISFLHNPIR